MRTTCVREGMRVDGGVVAVDEDGTGRGAPHRKRPVRWLSIIQLLRTAFEILKVSVYARGKRRRAEIAEAPGAFYQLTTGSADVRVDFVSDTGDGFDATFATAVCVARRPRADLLVLGGDLVYPVAKKSRYEERFTSVFRYAATQAGMGDEKPPVVALPGNHDWYDGLNAFLAMMCGSPATPGLMPVPVERVDVGGWGAFQSRSYFAIQLTADWWLWGIDSQLDAPIDDHQVKYFRQAKEHLHGADIILCTATPSWLKAAGDEAHRATEGSPLDSLLVFIDVVLGEDRAAVRLLLTGDKHHYAHYEPTEKSAFQPELVTCGGGGAFLSATHHLPETLHPIWRPWSPATDSTHYRLATTSPTADESRALVAKSRFLAAGVRNGLSLPALAGGIGAGLFWMFSLGPLLSAIGAGALFALLGIYAKHGKHAYTPKLRTGLVLTVGHTASHLALAAAAWWVLTHVVSLGFWWSLLAAFLVLAVPGTAVFVTYLHIADRFGWHTLEAFSGMRIERYKSHLRMRVARDGITVSVVGLNPPVAGEPSHRTTLPPEPRIIDEFVIKRRSSGQ